MKHIKRSAIVQYDAARMFALVADIEKYPEFLPWCARAQVLSAAGDTVTARVTIAWGGLHKSFTTRNRNTAGRSIVMRSVAGLFSDLHGEWRFTPLAAGACRVEFEIRFAIAGRVLAAVAGPLFEKISDGMVDAFHRRARSVYGSQNP